MMTTEKKQEVFAKEVKPYMLELFTALMIEGYPYFVQFDELGQPGQKLYGVLIFLPNGKGLHLVRQELMRGCAQYVREHAVGTWDALEVHPIGYDGNWEHIHEDPSDWEEKLCDTARVLEKCKELLR